MTNSISIAANLINAPYNKPTKAEFNQQTDFRFRRCLKFYWTIGYPYVFRVFSSLESWNTIATFDGKEVIDIIWIV